MTTLEVTIPGEPCAQGRARASLIRGRGGRLILGKSGQPIINVRDPEKSKSWKGAAQVHMQRAARARGIGAPLDGPLEVHILAVFTLPKSAWKKRAPVPRQYHTKRGDPDNIAKAVLDAANGVLLRDDAEVSRLMVLKLIGAQGEAPFVRVTVMQMGQIES